MEKEKEEKKENIYQFRLKLESYNRLSAFAEDQGLSKSDMLKRCIIAYKKRKPVFNSRHELNKFRGETRNLWVQVEKMPEEVKGDSRFVNEIVLWWTDINGKYPKVREEFKVTENVIIEEAK